MAENPNNIGANGRPQAVAPGAPNGSPNGAPAGRPQAVIPGAPVARPGVGGMRPAAPGARPAMRPGGPQGAPQGAAQAAGARVERPGEMRRPMANMPVAGAMPGGLMNDPVPADEEEEEDLPSCRSMRFTSTSC